MVHLPTLEAQEKYFEKHRREILNSEDYFAVIYPNKIEYFKNKKLLYKKHPYFIKDKDDKIQFGRTLPKLIDIKKEKTKLLEYRLGKIRQENKKCEKDLIRFNRRKRRLDKIEKGLTRRIKNIS